MCCAILLIGFESENLLEEASVDMLLYVDLPSEFCCRIVDIFGLDTVWSNGRLLEKCSEILGSTKPKNYDSVFIYVYYNVLLHGAGFAVTYY
jgi:hypothetical protein